MLLVWPAAAAALSGTVRLLDSTIPAVQKGRDYAGVVVWLEPIRAADVPAHAPDRPPARIEQRDKQFTPHVLAIQAGSQVAFPNLDPIFHSAFSNYSGQVFDLGLYAPGTSRTVTFDRPGIVRVFCNIHLTMSAVIVVLKYPWFAVTDSRGAFAIQGVPAGDYDVHVYYERATDTTLEALRRRVTVSAEDLTLPVLVISETGHVEMPHKNKYGQDYPPEAATDSDYRGGHR